MAKIAISLPDEVLQAVEKERLARGLSRGEFLRNAVEAFLRHRRERELEEQYIRGYQEYPETADDRALAESTVHYAFDEDSDGIYWEEEFRK